MYMKQPATGHIALQRLNSYFCIAYHQNRNQSDKMPHSVYKKVTILLHLQNKCLILERKIIQLIV